MIERFGPPLVRSAIRYLPPGGRGIRLAHGFTTRWPPRERVYISRERSGARLRCDLRDELSRVVYYRGWVDAAIDRWFDQWLRPSDTYVDVGAHIGYFVSRALRRVGATGRVVAIEPNPDTFAKLAAAFADSRLEVIEAAAGDSSSRMSIRIAGGVHRHQSSRASLVGLAHEQQHGPEVDVRRLDEMLAGRRVRLLKIDTEGFEAAVLRGAHDTLTRTDAVLVEINRDALAAAGSAPDEVLGLLGEAGFRPHPPANGPGSEFEDVILIRGVNA
ncbi:MAG TPA: FkbM family methyltransferase [Solirubrobacteraceae bacterium]